MAQAAQASTPHMPDNSPRQLRLPVTIPAPCAYDIGLSSDVGNERENNEDFVGYSYETPFSLVMAIADGVGGSEGGELASHTAVEATLMAYRDQGAAVATEKRLYRSAQQANIEIYDKAIVVPELRGMSTTLTAFAIEGGLLHAAHVGDSRLYLLRQGQVTQITKDHTVVAERVRKKLMSQEKARQHPDHGVLTRSLGRELIAAVDRITLPIFSGDTLVLCTDGLHNIVTDQDLVGASNELDAQSTCQRLIDTANSIGTIDNLTVAVCRIVGTLPSPDEAKNWVGRLKSWLGSDS